MPETKHWNYTSKFNWSTYERHYYYYYEKHCSFAIRKESVERWKKIWLSINNDKPPGSDNLDEKLLRITADDIATPICHIFNLSLLESVCPQAWREAKVIPLE
jgi:hypothetical protein